MTETITIPRRLIEDALSEAGIWEFSIRDKYSGRFMYGKTCFGVVFDGYLKDRFIAALRNVISGDELCECAENCEDCVDDCDCGCSCEESEAEGSEEARKLAENVISRRATDNMGLQTIVYFPGVTLED